MTNDPVTRSVGVLIAFGATILVAGGVYRLAASRAAKAKAPATFIPPTTAPFLRTEPLELGGVEALMTQSGLLVTAVDGPGRTLGLQVGDVIRSIGGEPVVAETQLAQLRPGVPVGLLRNGKVVKTAAGIAATVPAMDVRPVDARGLSGQLTPEGLWVTSVEGDAAGWGLRPGDLVRSVDGRPFTVRRDGATLLRSLNPGQSFVFDVVRNGERVTLPCMLANTRAPARAWMAPMGAQPAVAAPLVPGPVAAAGAAQPGWNIPYLPAFGLGLLRKAVSTTRCPVCGAYCQLGNGYCARCGAALSPNAGGQAPMVMPQRGMPMMGAPGAWGGQRFGGGR
jgi:hypothetical protein